MSSGNRPSHEDELTPEERAQLEAFGVRQKVNARLKRNTTEALRARGLLDSPTPAGRGGPLELPSRSGRRATRLLAAAASVIVLAGAVEYLRVRHEPPRPERLTADSGAAARSGIAPPKPIVE